MTQPADVISLRGLTARGHHGVLEAETQLGQPFSVDVDMLVDAARAAADDDLTATVNYAEIADLVVAHIAGPPVALIETVALRIAEDVLAKTHVRGVRVVVHKPHAPVPHVFSDVAVTVRRGELGGVL